MNTLQIKPKINTEVAIKRKYTGADFERIFEAYKAKTYSTFNPTVKQCQQIAYDVFQKMLYEALEKDPAADKVFKDFNALMSHAAPKWEFIKNYIKDQKAETKDFRRTYTPQVWEQFSKAVQNRHTAGAEADLRERKLTFKDIDRVFVAQDKITAGFDDDKFLEMEEIAESTAAFALDKIETHILPDYSRTPGLWMRPSAIVKTLIKASHGFIVDYDKSNIGAELDKQKWPYEMRRIGGKWVRGYFVELVKG